MDLQIKLHKASGQHYVYWKGKRYYLGEELKEAQRRYKLLKPTLEKEGVPPIEKTHLGGEVQTIYKLCTGYIESLNTTTICSSERSIIKKVILSLCEHYGGTHPNLFRAKSLLSFRAKLLETHPTFSRPYLNRCVQVVKRLFRWGAIEEIISSEVASSLWLVKPLTEGQGGEEREPIRPPVPGALDAILPYLRSPALELVQLLALTGLRPWEAIRMRPCEIARDPLNPIPIPRSRRSIGPQTSDQGLIWVFVPLSHKTSRRGKFKLTPLGPKAQAILTPLLEATPPDGFLFQTRHKKAYRQGSFSNALRRAFKLLNRDRKEQGLPPLEAFTPYQLRHLTASTVSEAFDRTTAKAVLGHSGYDLLDVYIEQELGKATLAAATLG